MKAIIQKCCYSIGNETEILARQKCAHRIETATAIEVAIQKSVHSIGTEMKIAIQKCTVVLRPGLSNARVSEICSFNRY